MATEFESWLQSEVGVIKARRMLERLREEVAPPELHFDVCPDCEQLAYSHTLDAPPYCPHEYERYVPVRMALIELTPPPADEIEELNAPYDVDESRYGLGGGCPSPDAEPYAHLPWHERVEAVRESNQRAGGDNYGG